MPSITQATIDQARKDVEAGKTYDVTDRGLGLVLRVGRRGAKWAFRAERYGRTVRLTLGSLDLLKLAHARQLAQAAQSRIRDHRAPVDEAWLEQQLVEMRIRKPSPAPVLAPKPSFKDIVAAAEADRMWTFSKARDHYLAEVQRTRREATWRDYRHVLAMPELAPLADIRVHKIGLEGMARIVADVHESGRERQAEHLASVLRPMWTYLATPHLRSETGIPVGRMAGLRAPERSNAEETDDDTPGTYVPSVRELATVLAIVRSGAVQDVVAAAVELMVLTGQRRRTIVSARKRDFLIEDGVLVWRIPPAHRKTARKRGDSRTHDLPLPARARTIVEPLLVGGGTWLFPGYRPRKAGGPVEHVNESVLNHTLRIMPGVEASPHDVRRGLTTHGQDVLGLTLAEIKMILDHNEGFNTDDVTESSYSRARRLTAKAAVLDPWAALLEQEVPAAAAELPSVKELHKLITEARKPKRAKASVKEAA